MFGGGVFPPVVAHLLADISEFSAKMGEAEALQAKVAGSGAASWQKASKEMMGVGTVMAVAAGAVAAETIHSAAEFDAMMERVHTMAGASQAEVDGLKQKVLDLGMATGQGPEKLAEALYHVESVGYRGKVAMEVLTNASKLAAISGADLDETTYGLTSVMQTFGAKAGEASKYAALFNATVGAGDMQMEAFNRAVGTGFYSVAQTFGVSAQSASGALAFMTDRGAHADEAATRLRMTIALLAAPSQKSTAILKELGLTSESVGKAHKDMNGILTRSKITFSQLATDLKKPDGFYEALKHLKKGLEDSGLSAEAANAQLSHAFGGGKSDASILAMLNDLDTLHSKFVAVGKGMGNYGESFSAAQKTAKNQMDQLKSTVSALGIEIGQVLMPYALAFLNWLKDGAKWAATHQGAVEAIALVIGTVLVAGLALATAGMIAFAVSTAAAWAPIFLGIIVILAVVAAIILLWTHWRTIWGWIVGAAKVAWHAIVAGWDWLKDKTSEIWGDIIDWITNTWKSFTAWISDKWHAVVDPLITGWNWLKAKTIAVFTAIKDWFAKWWPLLLVIFMPPIAILLALWNHFHEAIWTFMVNTWNNIKGWLSTAWNWIVDKATTAWNLFYDYVVAPVVRAAKAVARWIGWIKDHVVAGFNAVKHWVSTAWNVFYSLAIAPIVRLAKSVGGWMKGVWTAITHWFQSVLDWASTLWGAFKNIGGSIVRGIVAGIQEWAQWAWDQVCNFANSLLDAAKSFLGINSPSKLFRDVVGKSIPEGIAVGVEAHAYVAADSVTGLADKLKAKAKSAYYGSLTSDFSGQVAVRSQHTSSEVSNQTVRLDVAAKVDRKVLFEIVQEMTLQYQKKNGAPAFGS